MWGKKRQRSRSPIRVIGGIAVWTVAIVITFLIVKVVSFVNDLIDGTTLDDETTAQIHDKALALQDEYPDGYGLAVVIIEPTGPRADMWNGFLMLGPRTPRGLVDNSDFSQSIPVDGILFDYGEPRSRASFRLKNAAFDLDIVFIRESIHIEDDAHGGRVMQIVPSRHANAYSQITVGVRMPIVGVLGLQGGQAAALGLTVGDSVRWEWVVPDLKDLEQLNTVLSGSTMLSNLNLM